MGFPSCQSSKPDLQSAVSLPADAGGKLLYVSKKRRINRIIQYQVPTEYNSR